MNTLAVADLTPGTWEIDPVHSSINFWVRHLMVSKVRGRFDTFSGVITIAENGTPSLSAEIAVTSINTGSIQRDEHVRAADFFEVEKFPTATFRSTSIVTKGESFILTGNCTLHGVTKSIDLSVQFNGVNPGGGSGTVAGFEATVVLNRKDFGINFDMPLEVGGAMVGDKVTIDLEIEALKKN
ncbi:YceI family protein [Rhodococcus sp. USK13]|uniref:YceI family protein n=1 Tax=Rhodococcus sp. USK13 TaxID=2806442 RepID=UPI001BD14101|nr:YceI family protein [Rhodococcus sp. USK13]